MDGFLATPWPMLAAAGLSTIAVPFLIAGALKGKGYWDYPTLFAQSWSIVVRYAAAWLFTGVVWALIYLSDALFGLVGLRVIERLLEWGPAPWLITGFTLGLALAVVEEMSDYVTPFLVLRLFRILLPAVLLVVVVFLIALPFRGLSNLFGEFSAAGILLAMAVGAATLVTTALDQSDEEAVDNPLMQRSARLLALLMPVLAGLGVWAIALRVGQYGWTPDRMAAAAAALVVLGYGALYALAVLGSQGWMGRIRRANVRMAVAMVVLAGLWLTPVLNAEAWSARSQMARFDDGRVKLEDLDLWALKHDWGRPGAAALADLRGRADGAGQEALRARLAALDKAAFEFEFQQGSMPDDTGALQAELKAMLPVRPEGNEAVLEEILAASRPEEIRGWIEACGRLTAGGKPGCVLVVGEFLLNQAGPEAVLFQRVGPDYFRFEAFSLGADGVMLRPNARQIGGSPLGASEADAVLEQLEAGAFTIAPAAVNALSVGGKELMIDP